MSESVTVLGLGGTGPDSLSGRAREMVSSAKLLVGARRHLEAIAPLAGHCSRRVVIGDGETGLSSALTIIESEPGKVCVLASGDPGFFGIVRPLADRFGAERLEVLPAPSSVSLAFARLGIPWDDAAVVSAHGRPLHEAAALVAGSTKVAVLVSPENPPEALGRELAGMTACFDRIFVCSRLDSPHESVESVDLSALASRHWDPLSVVVFLRGTGVGASPTMAWGLGDELFDHRTGMITKAEVRAVVLGKLSLPHHGVVWDVGAGSGSVAIECARLSPGLRVIAVEADGDQARRVSANALKHNVSVEVVHGGAPEALYALPAPDRCFVGGGGLPALGVALARLRPAGKIVATFAALDRAAAAAEKLGALTQVSVSRGRRLDRGSWRLAAENPVFVVWGPRSDEPGSEPRSEPRNNEPRR